MQMLVEEWKAFTVDPTLYKPIYTPLVVCFVEITQENKTETYKNMFYFLTVGLKHILSKDFQSIGAELNYFVDEKLWKNSTKVPSSKKWKFRFKFNCCKCSLNFAFKFSWCSPVVFFSFISFMYKYKMSYLLYLICLCSDIKKKMLSCDVNQV